MGHRFAGRRNLENGLSGSAENDPAPLEALPNGSTQPQHSPHPLPPGKQAGAGSSASSKPSVKSKNHVFSGEHAQKAKPVEPLEVLPPPTPLEQWLQQSASQKPPLLPEKRVRAWWLPIGQKETTGFLVSFLVHLMGILLLAWIGWLPGVQGQPSGQWLGSLENEVSGEELLWDGYRSEPVGQPVLADSEPIPVEVPLPELPVPWSPTSGALEPERAGQQPVVRVEPAVLPRETTEPVVQFVSGGGLEGRDPKKRREIVLQRGGSEATEKAVERGLRWLAAHQMPNGGWDFDHRKANCPGLCRNPGSHGCTTAATSLALLAFLGAGYTHRDGPYQETVHRGFYYLLSRGVKAARGIDFMEGTMYGHGLAAIALSEAYAMTGDPLLKQYAQAAIDFIVYAQDKTGGGWRYQPGQPGDSTVTGWQLMALRSGQMAGLNVPSPSLVLAWKFLDSVQTEQGALYGYMDPAPRRSTSAIGLLCRMYLGWRPEHPALRRGIAYVDQWGPSEDDIYYNYYAAQLMHHWGGQEWKRWNGRMRDFLVRTQATQGHEAGSWYFDGQHTRVGGRLFSTAAATMTLEVYYRYMPLYETRAVQLPP